MADDATMNVYVVKSNAGRLYPQHAGELGLLNTILQKAEDAPALASSVLYLPEGRRTRPFDMKEVEKLDISSAHHSTCIQAKVNSTVGLGFKTEDEKKEKETFGFVPSHVDEVLNPMTDSVFQSVLSEVGEDFFRHGAGYFDVVRNRVGGKVEAIHHMPAIDLWAVSEKGNSGHYHWEIDTGVGDTIKIPRWGDTEDFLARNPDVIKAQAAKSITDTMGHEILQVRKPSAKAKIYGYPEWLAAVPLIELNQKLNQFFHDFFDNRGVPEFILLVKGGVLTNTQWEKIEKALKNNIGSGNAFKSMALNVSNANIEIEVIPLGINSMKEDFFNTTRESLASEIVSAHRVPPLLAGIQIPGKLGANNELPNALAAFQLLVVGQSQGVFQQVLSSTLGSPEAGLGLTPEDFTLRSITDELDLENMDTMGRMREPVTGSGRNVNEGLKD